MKEQMKVVVACVTLVGASHVYGQGYDIDSTPGIDEGSIGAGYDEYGTPRPNEGNIGSGYYDSGTPVLSEGNIGSGNDAYSSPGLSEDIKDSGYDNDPITGSNAGNTETENSDYGAPQGNEGAW